MDVKVCAVTDVWSGLKFVRRVKDRKEPAKTQKTLGNSNNKGWSREGKSSRNLEPSCRRWSRLAPIDSNFARTLCRSGAHDEMGHKRNYCKQQQQMNQSAGYVEHQKATGPQNQQQQSNHEEWSESH